jgi:hypothetical protein
MEIPDGCEMDGKAKDPAATELKAAGSDDENK